MNLFQKINSLHPTIKFTFSYSKEKIPFLDTVIHLDHEGNLSSSLHIKPTDTFSLLHFSSFHPDSSKKSIIYSQALRYRLLITKDSELKEALRNLKNNFIFRGYPRKMIDSNINKVLCLTQQDLLDTSPKEGRENKHGKLVFSTLHSIHNPEIKRILLQNWHIIEQDPTLKTTWPSPAPVTYKR